MICPLNSDVYDLFKFVSQLSVILYLRTLCQEYLFKKEHAVKIKKMEGFDSGPCTQEA